MGICTVAEFIFGLPGETTETLNKTLSFVRRMRPHVVQYNLLRLIEGTPLYKQASFSQEAGSSRLFQARLQKVVFFEYLKHFFCPTVLWGNFIFILCNNPRYFMSAGWLLLYPFSMMFRLLFARDPFVRGDGIGKLP